MYLFLLLFVFLQSIHQLGTNWGQGLGQTGDITAIFTANFAAIICYIAWSNFHLNLECRDKINVELCELVAIFLQICLYLSYTLIEQIDIAQCLTAKLQILIETNADMLKKTP